MDLGEKPKAARPALWLMIGYALGFYNAGFFIVFKGRLPPDFTEFSNSFGLASLVLILVFGVNALFLTNLGYPASILEPLEYLSRKVGRIVIMIYGFVNGIGGFVLPLYCIGVNLHDIVSILVFLGAVAYLFFLAILGMHMMAQVLSERASGVPE